MAELFVKPLNCFIIDDEELDRLFIKELVSAHKELNLLACYSNALESITDLRKMKVDLLFLDIDMPVINGVDFIKKLEKPPLCIFVTSHPEYALDAFDVHAIDYLLKPVKKERFELALKRASELFSIREKALHYELSFEKETITIIEGNTINKVSLDEIVYLEALTNYTKVVTLNRNYITLKNLKSFLDYLPSDRFIRIHRSYAVAKNKIKSLNQGEIMAATFTLPLGKTYKREITNILRKH